MAGILSNRKRKEQCMENPFNANYGKRRWNIQPHIGRVFIEIGYYSGMYSHGDDALFELTLAHYIRDTREPCFNIFNIRIWKLVLCVSIDLFKRSPKHVQ